MLSAVAGATLTAERDMVVAIMAAAVIFRLLFLVTIYSSPLKSLAAILLDAEIPGPPGADRDSFINSSGY